MAIKLWFSDFCTLLTQMSNVISHIFKNKALYVFVNVTYIIFDSESTVLIKSCISDTSKVTSKYISEIKNGIPLQKDKMVDEY